MSKKIAFTGNVFPFGEGIAYGGERILYYLATELKNLGYHIHVFAADGCNFPKNSIDNYTPVKADGKTDVHYKAIKESGINFDIYHCNYFGDAWDKECSEKYPYVEFVWNVWCHYRHQLGQTPFNVVTYSHVLHQDFLNIGVKTTMIHLGLPETLYEFNNKPKEYCVWIGKVEGGKAPELAIKLAKASGIPIVLMGPPYHPSVHHAQVSPYVDNETVFWLRGVDDNIKGEVMRNAKFFISSNDNSWKEHFGIVNIEALACGTPIIAFNRINQDCAIKTDNIIEDGKHGFFLNYYDSNNHEEILEKGLPLIKRINEIERIECRRQFKKRFTTKLMALRYDHLYKQIASGGKYEEIEIPF